MIKSFFGLFNSKIYINETKAACIIQKHYKTYLQKNNEEKSKLMKSMNDIINNSYNIIGIDKYGKTIVYKEQLETSSDDYSITDDYIFYLQERKRIKTKPKIQKYHQLLMK